MINTFFAIFLKDLRIAIKTPVGYVLSASYLFISGFFFFNYLVAFNPAQKMSAITGENILNFNTGVIVPLYQAQMVILLFIIPLVAMKAISEEKARGSLELILSTRISLLSLVLGKWCAVYSLLAGVICLGFVYPLSIVIFGDPEVLPVFSGLLGLLLYAAVLSAMGIFISSMTHNQSVAGIVTLILSFGWFLVDAPFSSDGSDIAIFVRSISLASSTDRLLHGVISLPAVYLFVSSSVFFIFLAVQMLSLPRGSR
ncbi:MAG TPA: ABC transporter permease subunit [Oligoflexia bacterium]|nr:ABC transporter permease subunit [Oligoflexia bacterium]HMP48539.1 ABC transporter permease subunit [Oligoflexia bacterium]